MGLTSSSYEFEFESSMFLFSSNGCFKQSGGSFLQLQLSSPTISSSSYEFEFESGMFLFF